MKKLIAILFAVIVVAAAFVGCNPSTNETSSTEGTSSVEDTSSVETVDPATKLNDILTAIKAEYGENYIPSMPLDVDMFSEMYMIDKANIEALVAEMPMMSAHIDRFIGIKAVEGKGAEVETALKAYYENDKANLAWYPQNAAKTETAKIIAHGDYVFYVILGAYPTDETLDEAAQIDFAEAEVKKAVDIINAAF